MWAPPSCNTSISPQGGRKEGQGPRPASGCPRKCSGSGSYLDPVPSSDGGTVQEPEGEASYTLVHQLVWASPHGSCKGRPAQRETTDTPSLRGGGGGSTWQVNIELWLLCVERGSAITRRKTTGLQISADADWSMSKYGFYHNRSLSLLSSKTNQQLETAP